MRKRISITTSAVFTQKDCHNTIALHVFTGVSVTYTVSQNAPTLKRIRINFDEIRQKYLKDSVIEFYFSVFV